MQRATRADECRAHTTFTAACTNSAARLIPSASHLSDKTRTHQLRGPPSTGTGHAPASAMALSSSACSGRPDSSFFFVFRLSGLMVMPTARKNA